MKGFLLACSETGRSESGVGDGDGAKGVGGTQVDEIHQENPVAKKLEPDALLNVHSLSL